MWPILHIHVIRWQDRLTAMSLEFPARATLHDGHLSDVPNLNEA